MKFNINEVNYEISNYHKSEYLLNLVNYSNNDRIPVDRNNDNIISLKIDFDDSIISAYIKLIEEDIEIFDNIQDEDFKEIINFMCDKCYKHKNFFNFDNLTYRKLYLTSKWHCHSTISDHFNHDIGTNYFIAGNEAYESHLKMSILPSESYYFFIDEKTQSKVIEKLKSGNYHSRREFIRHYEFEHLDDKILFYETMYNKKIYVYLNIFKSREDIMRYLEEDDFSDNLECLLETSTNMIYISDKFKYVVENKLINIDSSKVYESSDYVRKILFHYGFHSNINISYLDITDELSFLKFKEDNIKNDQFLSKKSYIINIDMIHKYFNDKYEDQKDYNTLLGGGFDMYNWLKLDEEKEIKKKVKTLCDELNIKYVKDDYFSEYDIKRNINNKIIIESLKYFHFNITKINFNTFIRYLNSENVKNIFDFIYNMSSNNEVDRILALILFEYFNVSNIRLNDDKDKKSIFDSEYIIRNKSIND